MFLNNSRYFMTYPYVKRKIGAVFIEDPLPVLEKNINPFTMVKILNFHMDGHDSKYINKLISSIKKYFEKGIHPKEILFVLLDKKIKISEGSMYKCINETKKLVLLFLKTLLEFSTYSLVDDFNLPKFIAYTTIYAAYVMGNKNMNMHIRQKIKDNCVVCYRPTNRTTLCKHYLCKDCFRSINNKKCPYCKSETKRVLYFSYKDQMIPIIDSKFFNIIFFHLIDYFNY